MEDKLKETVLKIHLGHISIRIAVMRQTVHGIANNIDSWHETPEVAAILSALAKADREFIRINHTIRLLLEREQEPSVIAGE